MSGVIGSALVRGDGWAELDALLAMPWGVVSLVDLYVGFSLFSAWIWLREGPGLAAAAWTLGMMCGGFWTGSLYVLLAALRSGGSATRLMLGDRRAYALLA